jgi:hypothetical protein
MQSRATALLDLATIAGSIGPGSDSIGLAKVLFFCFFQMINRGVHPNVPASVNRLTVTGTGDRRRRVTINRDLSTAADVFARLG